MHQVALLLAVACTATLSAQIQLPIPPFVSTFNGTAYTRGYWFQTPVPFVVTGMRVPDESNHGMQNVELILLPSAPPAFPGTIVGTQRFYAAGVPSSQIIPMAVTFNAGDFIGVLGACGDATMMRNSYAGNGAFTSSLLGQPVTLTRFGTQTNLASSGGNQACWQEAAYQVSRVELYYGGGQGFATFLPYGTGCYSYARSYYERFATAAAFDFGNTTTNNGLMHLPTGSSYVVVPSSGGWRTPTGTNLALTDNSETTRTLPFAFPYPGGSTNQLIICSNGFLSLGTSNGVGSIADPSQLLSGNPRFCAFWHDLNPGGGGQVIYDVDPAGVVYVTWLAVPTTGGGGTNTFQVSFASTGIVEFRYQQMSGQATTSASVLVGWSPGGNARNAGSRDLTATLPFTTDPTDGLPLALTASARPVLGTGINLVTSVIPQGSPLGAMIFSFTRIDPGTPLVALGMPGCFQYVGLDSSVVFVIAGATNSLPVNIPSNPIHAGSFVWCQSATFSAGFNPLGVIASNGLELKLDLQ